MVNNEKKKRTKKRGGNIIIIIFMNINTKNAKAHRICVYGNKYPVTQRMIHQTKLYQSITYKKHKKNTIQSVYIYCIIIQAISIRR